MPTDKIKVNQYVAPKRLNYDGEDCCHCKAKGVDLAPFGPEKVLECLECGWLFHQVPNLHTPLPTITAVGVEDMDKIEDDWSHILKPHHHH